MSLLDLIRRANTHDLSGFRPFVVLGRRYGFLRHTFAESLREWPEVFDVADDRVALAAHLDSPATDVQARSHAVEDVCQLLRDRGVIDGWRGESYPVCERFGAPPVMLLERAAVPLFGVTAYGVHMNGFVRDHDGGLKIWVARRALDKPTDPGKLDQMVAGGQPHGIGLRDNMIKECAEEAGIPEALAQTVRSVGALGYVMETHKGLKPDVIVNFDLELPADFEPENCDGEVEDFTLMPVQRVVEILETSDRFKLNCALVLIDFLLRHGIVEADHPDYQALATGLHPEVRPDRLPC